MSLKKHGVSIDCAHCSYIESDDTNSFDITVPVGLDETKGSRKVKLRCTITPEQHKVELLNWEEEQNSPALLADSQQHISEALTFVAEKKLCGHGGVCPSEVIQIVKTNS